MARVDPNKMMVLYLKTITGLQTLVANRTFGPPLGIPHEIAEPKNFIRIAAEGGPGSPTVPIAEERFAVHCYGTDDEQAMAVWLAMAITAERQGLKTITDGARKYTIIRIDRDGGPSHIPDKDGSWPRVVGFLRVSYIESDYPTA